MNSKIKMPENVSLHIKFLFIVLAFFLFFYEFSKSLNDSERNKKKLKEEISSSYKHIIIEKMRDSNNRNMPYLTYENGERKYEHMIIWKKIDVGDTLEKINGNSIINIYKKDTTIFADYKDVYMYYDSVNRR